jgi:hypothetical protein
MKLCHLLSLLHTMEPDATVTVRILVTKRNGDIISADSMIEDAKQIRNGTQAVIRLIPEDDLKVH